MFTGRDALFRSVPDTLIATSMTAKTLELARITADILSIIHGNSTTQIASRIGESNAKLCAWQDSLPAEMKWNRWSGQHVAFDQSIAALQ